jgi:trimeric autotransporter adhesin
VDNNWATIGGGATNSAGDGNGAISGACCQTIGGGYGNWARADRATIAGGGPNTVSGTLGTVGGGMWNTAGFLGTVAGGDGNSASGDYTSVGGGQGNAANASYDTVAGGYYNTATASSMATVGGGISNTASGQGATVPGGDHNRASGFYSFAAGCQANAANDGAFVWSSNHNQCTAVYSSVDSQFVANAPGGFWLGNTLSDIVTATQTSGHFLETTTGAYLTTSGTWTNASDRNLKTAFQPVDESLLLSRIGQLPMASWQYKVDSASIRHIGPIAQDFYAAFQLGNDDKHIATVDADGVALAGVQALYRLSLKKDQQIARLERASAAKDEKIEALSREIEQLRLAQLRMAAMVERLANNQRETTLTNGRTTSGKRAKSGRIGQPEVRLNAGPAKSKTPAQGEVAKVRF